METRDELMKKIMQYKFAVNDLSLYLDTHHSDRNALKLHNEYVAQLKESEKCYEEKFGPLTIESQMDTWQWVEDRWASLNLGVCNYLSDLKQQKRCESK